MFLFPFFGGSPTIDKYDNNDSIHSYSSSDSEDESKPAYKSVRLTDTISPDTISPDTIDNDTTINPDSINGDISDNESITDSNNEEPREGGKVGNPFEFDTYDGGILDYESDSDNSDDDLVGVTVIAIGGSGDGNIEHSGVNIYTGEDIARDFDSDTSKADSGRVAIAEGGGECWDGGDGDDSIVIKDVGDAQLLIFTGSNIARDLGHNIALNPP